MWRLSHSTAARTLDLNNNEASMPRENNYDVNMKCVLIYLAFIQRERVDPSRPKHACLFV